VEVEQFSYVPQDLQFITLDLRHQIDTLIRLIEHGMDPTKEIKKLKGTLPLPFENYSPLWE
jgi:hypothetical protein